MPKYKMMISVLDAARFLSHLDLVRLFERACRRAKLPMAYSQGFNPHPKISFASPLAVGVAGEREFLEIELTEKLDDRDIITRLNENLIGGIKILAVRQIDNNAKPLMSQISRAAYRMECPTASAVGPDEIEKIIDRLLQQPEILVQRNVKGKVKTSDIRPGILALKAAMNEDGLQIQAELRTGSQGNVRPEEILKELEKAGLPIDCACCRIFRTGLYGEDGNGRKELW